MDLRERPGNWRGTYDKSHDRRHAEKKNASENQLEHAVEDQRTNLQLCCCTHMALIRMRNNRIRDSTSRLHLEPSDSHRGHRCARLPSMRPASASVRRLSHPPVVGTRRNASQATSRD